MSDQMVINRRPWGLALEFTVVFAGDCDKYVIKSYISVKYIYIYISYLS